MTISNLTKAVPPPLTPSYPFEGPWEQLEAQLGTSLPQDYKDLVRVYGSGQFMGFLSVHDPVPLSADSGFLFEVSEVRRILGESDPGLPLYPQPGGLLVCGSTDTGEYIFWLTRGLVSEWPIVVWDHDCPKGEELEAFECDLTDFIAGLVNGDICPRAFADDEDPIEGLRVFSPWPLA
jgi:hypothetical protein